MRDELLSEISVCIDCMFVHANGEYPGDPADRPADAPEAWALWGFGYHVTMGGTHTENCDAQEDNDVECDCENLGFSWQSCEGCGSNLGGDRYRFTTWRIRPAYAHLAAREALTRARTAREARIRRWALADVAEWRAYLSAIAASDRRFAIAVGRYKSVA